MRIIPSAEKYRSVAAELGCVTSMGRGEDDEEEKKFRRLGFGQNTDSYDPEGDSKVVCVTSGLTSLGRALVDRLLLQAYYVRITVDNPDDMERVTAEMMDETAEFYGRIEAVTAKLTEVESLVEAFEGCSGVFHTSGFVDPSGVSGYSKVMAELEAKASESVMEACTRTESVKKCVMTSSLLACIWRNGTQSELPSVVDDSCWSDESFCKDKKLWYALGKLKAEKIAWKIAEAKGLKLSTICPALVTGLNLLTQNSTPTIAYLKGAQEMSAKGLLATVDAHTLAKAHVRVFEAMKKTAFGRCVCFDRVIASEYEAEDLAKQTGISLEKIRGDKYGDSTTPFGLSDRKLSSLLSRPPASCRNEI